MGLTFVFLIMAIIYLPILLLVFLSFSDGLDFYVQLFTTSEYMSAVGNTLLIAVVASVIATIIAAMAATGILYMGKRTRAVTMAVNQLPVINADIVTSFSLVLLFVSVGLANFGLLKLLLAHILIALPFCLLTILPKMRQLDANLIDAALDLGASPFKAFTSVIIPQLVPAMLQAFLLGFTLSLDDFVITQYNNSGVPTISTVIYGAISRRDIPDAFKALTTIIFIVILIVLVVMNLNAARVRKGIKINRKLVAGILAGILLLTGAGVIPVIINNLTPRSMVLKVYNWEDYIETELLDEFTDSYREQLAKQGVPNADKFRIEYHTFADNEELYSKINTQHADYDLIFPSEYMVEKMAQDGLLQTIDMTRISDEVELDQSILDRTKPFTDVYDANNNLVANQVWAIPYMIGTLGIMYDTRVIEKMADETKIDLDKFETLLTQYGFGVLFGEGGTTAYEGRITMKKSARDSIAIAMIYSAQKDNNPSGEIKNAIYMDQTDGAGNYDNRLLQNIINMNGDYDIEDARKVLMEQIITMDPTYENDNGKKSFMDPNDDKFAYGLFWSCDAGLAMYELMEESEDGENPLRYYAPNGTNLWTDNFAIPTYAQNTDAAYAFINFLLDDENAARNIDYVGSQMVAVGEAIDDLKADYEVPDDLDNSSADNVDGIFNPDINYACTVFPNADNVTYAAIMKNFDAQKEKAVNTLIVEVQNKNAQHTEDAVNSVNWFGIIIIVFASASLAWWLIYKLTHRRPRLKPAPLLPEHKA
ncbi:MAG: extracellular solute-binding protein [Clostridia bacterium]|nr:extracellular solute-binding protein [Clostridia bacterium]